MNLHEYQAKQVLAGFGVPVPRGVPVLAPDGIEAAVDELGGPVWVVKAQIHAGGRGKAGGVKVCTGRDEAIAAAQAMFGKVLVTHQTGPAGREVRRVYLEEGADIAHEYYLGAVVDRESGRVALIASREGGVEIETVAGREPASDRDRADRSRERLPAPPRAQPRLRPRPLRRTREGSRQARARGSMTPCSTPTRAWSRSTP